MKIADATYHSLLTALWRFRSFLVASGVILVLTVLSAAIRYPRMVKESETSQSVDGQVITQPSQVTPWLQDAWSDFQTAELLLIGVFLVIWLWPRRWYFLEMIFAGPFVALLLLVLLSICLGLAFSDYGLFILFWSDQWPVTTLSALIVILTVTAFWMMLTFLFVNRVDNELVETVGQLHAGVDVDVQRVCRIVRLSKSLSQPAAFGTLPFQDASRKTSPRRSWSIAVGELIWSISWPIAILLAVPALLPEFAVVGYYEPTRGDASELSRWLRSLATYYQHISLPWLLGLVLGLATIRLAIPWMRSQALLIRWFHHRQPGDRLPRPLLASALTTGPTVLAFVALLLLSFLTANLGASSLSQGGHRSLLLMALMLAILARPFWWVWASGKTFPPRIRFWIFLKFSTLLLGALLLPLLLGWLLASDQQSGLVSTVSVCFLLLLLALMSTVLSLAFSTQFRARTFSLAWPRRLVLKITPRRIQFLGIGLVVLAVYLNGLNPYKVRFRGLSGYPPREQPISLSFYENQERQRLGRVVLPDPDSRTAAATLLDDRQTLQNWLSLHDSAALEAAIINDRGDSLPKLAIVACSGGGLRAAIWTALVLRNIEEAIPEFPQDTRMIFGASGGMLGASYYVSSLQPSPEAQGSPRSILEPDAFLDALNTNFLAQAIRALAFNDFLSLISPFTQTTDRGEQLEAAWVDRLPALRDLTFQNLLDRGEYRAALPSLVFSPMLVEDSRRLVISNLDLASLTLNHGDFDRQTGIDSFDANSSEFPYYSRSGIELFRLDPSAQQHFLVSTAARMNATFPLISPAATLPTMPPRRVVDAGFYDNYGVELAVEWLEQHRDWLLTHTSGVALIQVRAFTNEIQLRQLELPAPAPSPLMKLIRQRIIEPFDRGTQFLTTPLTGVSTARQNVMSYRNDAAVEMLKRRFTFDRFAQIQPLITLSQDATNSSRESAIQQAFSQAHGFLRIFTFTCSNPGLEEVETLNWFLGSRDYKNIKSAWNTPLNTYRFDMLKNFFRKYGQEKEIVTTTTTPAVAPEKPVAPSDLVP